MAMIENEMEKKVYKVEDVQNLLGLGRSKAYEFIENVYQKTIPGVEDWQILSYTMQFF